MALAPHKPAKLILRDTNVREESYSGWHALAPALLGLVIPGLVAYHFFPETFSFDDLASIGLYLCALFVAAAVVFVYTVFNPKALVEVSFDPGTRTAELVRDGLFGTSRQRFAFRQIADVYMGTRFEKDGRKEFVPVMLLTTDETIELPPGTTQAHIDRIRKSILV